MTFHSLLAKLLSLSLPVACCVCALENNLCDLDTLGHTLVAFSYPPCDAYRYVTE